MSTNTATDPLPVPVVEGAAFDPETETQEGVTRYVVVNVNGNLYGMDTDSTVELMSASMTQITRVPHSPSFITGVINHRGTIIPVIDARELLGFKRRGEDVSKLKRNIRGFREEHDAWVDALEACVRDGSDLDDAIGNDDCAMGRWLASVLDASVELCRDDLLDPGVLGIVRQLELPHRRLHALSDQVVRLRDEGRRSEAIELISNAREQDLAEVHALLTRLIEALDRIYESMLVITEHEEQKAAIMVDGVSFVVDCTDAEIDALPDTADNTEFLTGLVHRPDGSYILITDLASVYAHACVTD